MASHILFRHVSGNPRKRIQGDAKMREKMNVLLNGNKNLGIPSLMSVYRNIYCTAIMESSLGFWQNDHIVCFKYHTRYNYITTYGILVFMALYHRDFIEEMLGKLEKIMDKHGFIEVYTTVYVASNSSLKLRLSEFKEFMRFVVSQVEKLEQVDVKSAID